MPISPALGRQRQVELCELKASLVYRVSSRTTRTVSSLPKMLFCHNYNTVSKTGM